MYFVVGVNSGSGILEDCVFGNDAVPKVAIGGANGRFRESSYGVIVYAKKDCHKFTI
jgi:hypothetical protein